MTAAEYKAERKQRGTQESVAALLGISRVSIARRETGEQPISREAELALLSIRKQRKKREVCRQGILANINETITPG